MSADLRFYPELWTTPGQPEVTLSESYLRAALSRVAGMTSDIASASVLPLPFGNNASKRYFEFEIVSLSASSAAAEVGLISNAWGSTQNVQDAFGYRATGVAVLQGTSQGGTYASWTTGDVIGFAYDPATAKVWVAKNNTWQNSSNPATPTGGITLTSGASSNAALAPRPRAIITSTASAVLTLDVRFHGKSSNLAYSPPSGFVAWDDGANTTPSVSGIASVSGMGRLDDMAAKAAAWPAAGEVATSVLRRHLPDKALVYGGKDYIDGTVDVANVLASRQVFLLDKLTKQVLACTWSDPTTGYFRFDGVNPLRRYIVIGEDYTQTYNGVIQDNLTL